MVQAIVKPQRLQQVNQVAGVGTRTQPKRKSPTLVGFFLSYSMETKLILEIQLKIVEDTLGKLNRQREKVEKVVYNIDRENRRREQWGKLPVPGLSQEEKETNERQLKALRNVMAVLRKEWANITTQLQQ